MVRATLGGGGDVRILHWNIPRTFLENFLKTHLSRKSVTYVKALLDSDFFFQIMTYGGRMGLQWAGWGVT